MVSWRVVPNDKTRANLLNTTGKESLSFEFFKVPFFDIFLTPQLGSSDYVEVLINHRYIMPPAQLYLMSQLPQLFEDINFLFPLLSFRMRTFLRDDLPVGEFRKVIF